MHTDTPYRPALFFTLSLLIPWGLWLSVAHLSHQPAYEGSPLLTVLILAGLFVPCVVSLWLVRQNSHLFADTMPRFFRLSGFPGRYLWLAILLPPLSLVAAQLISLLFGYEATQFYISGQASFSSTILNPWVAVSLAAVVEEWAWHSYGTDALLARFNLFVTSLIFTAYWAIWHLPLGFIKGYYHSELIASGWPYTVNFVVSMIVFVILMNHLYLKSNRSIAIACLFHLSANVGNEIFATHPDSKIIQTVILMVIAVFLVIKERQLFFKKPQ
ncbi:MAG: hypothetical protein Q3971_01430 [Moraxella sp.]|nr:hypothetical protein [Moraxella sp.]